MLFRFRYQVLGGHTHVKLFAGKGSLSLAKCGDLVFRNEEWEAFRNELEVAVGVAGGSIIEILEENE